MNIWLIIYRVSCAALAVMVIIGVAGIFLPKFHHNEARRRRIAELEEANRAKMDEVQDLRGRQERFKTDPAYVERIAREELGKAREGEVIFRFMEPETNSARGP